MKQYKVIAGQCPLPEQRVILDCGEVKDEDFFVDGQLAELIRRGFIAEVSEAEPIAEVVADPVETTAKKGK